MSLFNYCVLQIVRVLTCSGVFVLGLYVGVSMINLIGDKVQASPVASMIIMVATACITWLIGGGLLSLWRIEK